MRAIDAVSLCDELLPNAYSQEIKLQWLSELDGMIYRELIVWHEGAGEAPEAYSEQSELLVGAPYTGLYADYIAAMIHMRDAEFERYTNAMLRFNSAYSSFADAYNRAHKPLQNNKVHF